MKAFKLRFSFLLLFFTIFSSNIYSDDLCYEDPIERGFFFFFNSTVTPIKYIGESGKTIDNVNINYAIDGFNPISFGETIGIDDDKKSRELDNPDNGDAVYRADIYSRFDTDFGFENIPVTFFTDGINYNLGSMGENSTHDIWTKSFFSIGAFFTTTKLYANYVKDGTTYNVVLNPCEGTSNSVPSVTVSDAFIDSPVSWTTLTFNVDLTGVLSSSVSDYSYIHYYTQDGSAKDGTDYTYTEGTLTVAADTHSATIDVPILENSEGTFYLILDNAYAARINDGNATGTITANGTAIQTTPICGVFEDMFQTRGDCPSSTITFANGGQLQDGSTNIILQNSDNTLNTCSISVPDWVSNQFQTCGTEGDCISSGVPASSLDVIYVNPTLSATVNNEPSVSTLDVTLSSNTTLTANDYDDITTSWHTGISTIFNIVNSLKINTLKMTTDNVFTFSSNSSYTLDIGTLGIENNGVRNTISTDKNAKYININIFDLPSETTLSLEASSSIKMNNFTVGRASNVTLKAKHININNFISSNSGSGDSVINIYADYIDISNLTLEQTVTLNIYPYTVGKKILFRTNQLVESSSSSIVIDDGDYYINTSLTIPGTSNTSSIRARDADQIINLYINNDLSLGNNPGINAIGNNGNYDYTLPASKFMMFINGNLTTGGGGTTLNATVYVEGDATFGNPTYIKGAVSASTITVGQGQFIYDQDIANLGYGSCGGSIPSTGPFDAWDTFRDDASVPPADRNISTKIVNTAFQLSLASLNVDNDAYETKYGVDGNVEVAIYPKNSLTPVSNTIYFDANSTAHVANTVDITVNSAVKEAFVGFKLCATYENNSTYNNKVFVIHQSTDCSGSTTLNSCYALTSGSPTWHICYSTDNFAIRPDAFKVFGENQYKRAGEDFNITIKAVDTANNSISSGAATSVVGVDDYNVSIGDLSITSSFYGPTVAELATMKANSGLDPVDVCPQAGGFANINSGDSFEDGEIEATLIFTETGILDLIVAESIGSEFAIIDADDTSVANRLIQASTTTYDRSDISEPILTVFIPYQFQTSAEYNTTNSKNVLYMNNINTPATPNMAAMIKYTIEAQDKFGTKVQNYTKTCFPDTASSCPQRNGLKLNTTFDLFLDATIDTTEAIDVTFNTQDETNNAIWAPTANATYASGINTIQEWISPANFTNGTGKATVYFNIDRDVNVAVNPISVKLVDANTSTSWMANPGSPKAFNGTTLNTSKTFLYGKTHASRQRYTDTGGSANIYYEAYCDGSCDKNLLLPITTTNSLAGLRRTDDIRWFINFKHDETIDGSVGIVLEEDGTNVDANDIVDATDNPAGNPSITTITYDESKGYPYKTTMQNDASKWLIYNPNNPLATRNSFSVEFDKNGGQWSGTHDTNTTTNDSTTVKSNRRSMW